MPLKNLSIFMVIYLACAEIIRLLATLVTSKTLGAQNKEELSQMSLPLAYCFLLKVDYSELAWEFKYDRNVTLLPGFSPRSLENKISWLAEFFF